MNPCSVSVAYKWHERFRNGRKSTEDESHKNIIYTDRKNVNQSWCFEATEFKLYGNDVGTLRQHTEFSGRFHNVTNNADKESWS